MSALEKANWGDRVVLLTGLLLPSLVTWVYFVWLANYAAGVQQAAYGLGKTVQFLLPVVWIVLICRRRPHWKGPTLSGVAEGVGFGLLVLAAMLVVYHQWLKPAGLLAGAQQAVRAKIAGFGLADLPSYAALGVFYSLVHSLLEEYYWRWFVFGQLRRFTGLGVAIAVSSLGFMAHHVLVLAIYFGWLSPVTVLFSLAVAVGGAVWAWLFERTGTLYAPWFGHLLVDAGIFIIGYDLAGGLA